MLDSWKSSNGHCCLGKQASAHRLRRKPNNSAQQQHKSRLFYSLDPSDRPFPPRNYIKKGKCFKWKLSVSVRCI